MTLDLVGLGETCIDLTQIVDEFPEPDEKIFSLSSQRNVGGVTCNFCVGFARLGGKAGFIGGIGDDGEGTQIVSSMSLEGVNLDTLMIHKGGRTALNIILVNRAGEKMIIQDPLLRDNLPDPDEIDEGYITSARAFHTSAIKPNSALKAMRVAKEHGLLTSFDLEKHVSSYGLDTLKPILELTDLLMPNKLGAMSITDAKDPVLAARSLLRLGPKAVVMTMGSKGSLIATEGGEESLNSFKTEVLDTTGAGDAFNSAFLYGVLVKGLDFSKASIVANASAALKIRKVGAQSGLPTLEALSDFLKERLGYTLI